MQKFGKWLIGFAITFTLLGNNSYFVESVRHEPCIHSYRNDADMYAVCVNITYLSEIPLVPQYLMTNITVLEVINTDPLTLNETSFTRYPKLKRILIVHPTRMISGYTPTAHESSFLPLKRLQDLDISHSRYNTDFQWPLNISKLSVSGNKFSKLKLSNLIMLRELYASDCGLTEVPEIHESAPVTMLDLSLNKFPRDIDLSNLNNLTSLNIESCALRNVPEISESAPLVTLKAKNNPMDELTPESLAHYCLLNDLSLSITLINDSVTQEHYCRCSRVEKWLVLQEFDTNLDDFICPHPSKFSGCDFDLSEAADYREDCLTRHGKRDKPKVDWIRLIPALVTAFSFLAFLFYVVRFYARQAGRNQGNAAGERDEA